MRATYRGIDHPAVWNGGTDPEHVRLAVMHQRLEVEDGLSIGVGQTLELTPAQLAAFLELSPYATFDVEPGEKAEKLGPLARELERRGVSVPPGLGGAKAPKGHARWEAE